MNQIGFYFFGYFIAYYGLMLVLGILINIPIIYIQAKRFKVVINDFIIICALAALLGIIFAKMLYLITSYEHIDFMKLNDLSYINSLMNGGFVFLGGVIGFLLSLFFCAKIFQINLQPYIQAYMCCLPLGHMFGRIGCYLVGCCYGIPYAGFLSVKYTHSPFAPNGVDLFPVQLLEAFIDFLLAFFIFLFSKKLEKYVALQLYLLIYSISRFFLEFLRYDEVRNGIAGVSTSQILCILLFVIVSVCLFSDFHLLKKQK